MEKEAVDKKEENRELSEVINYILTLDIKSLMVKPSNNKYIQFFRYLFVGGIATIADWAVTYIATESGMYYLVSTALAFICGLVVNFVLSKLLVFKASESKYNTITEFILYGVIGLIGFGFTLGLMKIGVEILKLYYMGVRVVVTLIILFWNYFARRMLYKKS